MPKIEQVMQREQRRLPKLQKAVLDYLEGHPDEVYSWNREDLSTLLTSLKQKGTRGSIGWSIWALHRHGYIERLKVGRRYYYGSPEAIRRLATSVESQPARTANGKSAAQPEQAEAPATKAIAPRTGKAELVEVPISRKPARRRQTTRKTA